MLYILLVNRKILWIFILMLVLGWLKAASCLGRTVIRVTQNTHTYTYIYIYIYIYIQAGVVKYSVSEIFGDAGRSIHEYSRVSCFVLKRH